MVPSCARRTSQEAHEADDAVASVDKNSAVGDKWEARVLRRVCPPCLLRCVLCPCMFFFFCLKSKVLIFFFN